MKALIVDASSGFGGATTTLPGLVETLRDRGVDVVIAAAHQDGWDRIGLNVKPIPGDFQAASGTAYLWRELRRAAVLRRYLNAGGIDVVIANNDPAVNAAAYAAARGAAVPIVQILRGHARGSQWNIALLEAAAAVFSHGGAAEGIAAGCGDVVNRWHRLDEGLAASQWPQPHEPHATRWLWASTLATWKGLPLLLEAYGGLVDSRPAMDVCYVPLSADHSDAAAVPAAVPDGVVLHNHPRDLAGIRASASVYVHTSLIPEPFGRSILEAMAAGLCPIVPDEGGGARLVQHLHSGIVYRARSATSLREALALARDRPDLVAACGAQAAQAARSYTTTQTLAQLCDVVTSLASAQQDPPARHRAAA